MPSRRYPHNTLVKGQWLAECDICGFRFHSGDLKKNWKNQYVCRDDYEKRHEQDFVRGVPDNSSVPWTRPASFADTSTTTVDGSSLDTDITPDTVGDEDKELRVDGTPRMHSLQEWTTTFTQDNTVTFDNTDAVSGDRFTIHRTAGGDFDLIITGIKTTGIKSITVVEYNGSAWALISYTPTGL